MGVAVEPRGGVRVRWTPLWLAVTCAWLAACPGDRPAPRQEVAAGNVVAAVNGYPITREALAEFAASDANGGAARPLGPGEERQLLLRMVDEELLLQRAVETGLYRSDRRSREALLSAVIAGLGAERGEPDEADLRRHYEQNAAAFSRPGPPPAEVPPFPEVREEVRRSFLRQQRERDLRQLLDALRRQADVRFFDRALVEP